MNASARMGARACAWIVRHADDFFAPGEGERADLMRGKRIAELALLVGTLGGEMSEGPGLLARAWSEIGRGELIARLLPAEPIAATLYLPFRMAALRSSELEQLLAEESWRRDHAQWSPAARLAIGVTLESIGLVAPWDQDAAVADCHLFGRPGARTPPMRGVLLSHLVMWRTGMGRDCAGLSVAATSKYRAVARDWDARLTRAGLLDPLSEMAIANVCIGAAPSAASLALLCAVQHDDGAVPPHPDVPTTSFDGLYHSTVVAALAGLLAAPTESRSATWEQLRGELSRYRRARESEDEIVLAWNQLDSRSLAVVIRRVKSFGVDWLRVSAPIAYTRNLQLEPLLRQAEGGLGAVVVEGERCVLRETVCLDHIAPAAVHTLIEVIGRQTTKLARLAREAGRDAFAESYVD